MRSVNQFGNGVVRALGCVAVNANASLQIQPDPWVGQGGIELRLPDQLDRFGLCAVEAARMPVVAGLEREHPTVEGRKRVALRHPNCQGDFSQFARVCKFSHVARDVRIALTVQRRGTQGEGELAMVATNHFIKHEMHLLTMRALVIKEQIDDVGRVG